MSFILDALKKAERQREIGSVPGVSALTRDGRGVRPRHGRGGWALAVVAAVAASGLTWLAATGGKGTPATPAAAVAPAAPAAPTRSQPQAAPPPPEAPPPPSPRAPAAGGPPPGEMVAQVLRESAPTAEALAPPPARNADLPPPVPRDRVEFAASTPSRANDAEAARQALRGAAPGAIPEDPALAALASLSGRPAAPSGKPPWPSSSLVTAKVTAAHPGCRVELELQNWRYEVSLAGVRCPEESSPYAGRALGQIRQLTLDQNVVVSGKGGREGSAEGIRVDMFTPEGPLLNRELVRQGLARAEDSRFQQEEREAKGNRAGLWASHQGE